MSLWLFLVLWFAVGLVAAVLFGELVRRGRLYARRRPMRPGKGGRADVLEA